MDTNETTIYEGSRPLTEAELQENTRRLHIAEVVRAINEPPPFDRINGVIREDGRERAVEGLE